MEVYARGSWIISASYGWFCIHIFTHSGMIPIIEDHRSYSRLTAFEAARLLFRLGCDVRVYDPAGLPVKDDT